MNELAQALRDFADRIERGDAMPGASQCALVLSDDAGTVQATYIGRLVPSSNAGIHLLSAGIQRFNAGMISGPAAVMTHRGSTH